MRSYIVSLFFCLTVGITLTTSDALAVSYTLQTNPTYPQPEESFVVSLSGSAQNVGGIRWYIDGIEYQTGANATEITLQAGEPGTRMNILASLSNVDGSSTEVRKTIYTPRVDIHVYADTYTPSFYVGRALPSSGSTVRATALVFDQAGESTDRYSYRWRLNGKVLQGGIALRDNTISFSPNFEDELRLQVEVVDQTGTVVTQAMQMVPVMVPEIYFYEKNPLRGLSLNTIPEPYTLMSEESVIRAEPYYMDTTTNGGDLHMEWELNGKKAPSAGARNEISLQRNGAFGSALVTFHVRNLTQLLQGVKDSFTVQF